VSNTCANTPIESDTSDLLGCKLLVQFRLHSLARRSPEGSIDVAISIGKKPNVGNGRLF
jgi:hypothetical protein